MSYAKVYTQSSPVETEENYENNRTADSPTEIEIICLLNTNLQHRCYILLIYMFCVHVTSATFILLLTGRSPRDGWYFSNSSTTLECPLCEALNSAVAPSCKAHADIHMSEQSSVSNVGINI